LSVEIGKRLKRAREMAGYSIEDVEARTRIPKQYLIALENGQFELLPSPIHVRSYLRSFANAVGENPQTLLKLYQSQSHTQPVQTVPSFPSGRAGYGVSRDLSATGRFSTLRRTGQELEDVMAHESLYDREEPGHDLSDFGHTRPMRTLHVRGTSAARAFGNESGSDAYVETSEEEIHQVADSLRRPTMPPDVPDPEELGIVREPEYEQIPSPPSAPVYQRSQRRETQQKTSRFGRLYTRLLIIGAVALLIATALFFFYRMQNASHHIGTQNVATQTNQNHAPAPQKQAPKTPFLEVMNTSPDGSDQYELVNADKVELKITGLRGPVNKFEIREQEAGSPIDSGLVAAGQVFTKSYSHGIWIKLFRPNRVQVLINDKPIKTDIYSSEKDFYISLVH
jgi:cytoskeletal protein RodZ